MLFSPHDKGQALVDYSLIILLVAIVIIASLIAFQGALQNLYNWIISHWPPTS